MCILRKLITVRVSICCVVQDEAKARPEASMYIRCRSTRGFNAAICNILEVAYFAALRLRAIFRPSVSISRTLNCLFSLS